MTEPLAMPDQLRQSLDEASGQLGESIGRAIKQGLAGSAQRGYEQGFADGYDQGRVYELGRILERLWTLGFRDAALGQPGVFFDTYEEWNVWRVERQLEDAIDESNERLASNRKAAAEATTEAPSAAEDGPG